MTITLAEVFDKHLSNVKFNSNLAKDIYKYQIGYINQNREYLEFFGGNLLGVQVIRFKDSDVLKLFNDILDIDYDNLSNDLKSVTDVKESYKVASDVFNLTCFYLIHKFLTSPILTDTQRKRAAYDCGLIFFYRTIAALQSYYFRYPSDPKIAQMAYANLSNKYLIKRLGSWHKVMDYRANDLIDKDAIHYKNLIKFNNDLSIVYAIEDAQGRIRDLYKNYCFEFYKVHEEGDGIGSKSGTYIDAEGNDTIKEKTKSVERYVLYAKNILTDKHSFIKDDLVKVINNINSNTSFRMIKHTLGWISDNYNDSKYHNDIDEFITLTIIFSIYLITNNMKNTNTRDYPTILHNIKNLYLSTRSTDPDLVKIKDIGERLIKASNKDISNSLILSTRTSIILYITLRVLSGVNK